MFFYLEGRIGLDLYNNQRVTGNVSGFELYSWLSHVLTLQLQIALNLCRSWSQFHEIMMVGIGMKVAHCIVVNKIAPLNCY